MSRQIRSLPALLSLLCIPVAAPALAQQPPYMTLVGELVGAIDSPRVVMETCVTRKAGRREALKASYDAWRARHAPLLAQVDEQLSHADARLRRDNPAAGTGSVAEAMTRILQRRYDALDAAGLRQLCGRYDEMLRAKDVEMEATIPELLKRVSDADRALAGREPRS
jgi:hypothetical protein